jgi:hypothetical protein
MARAASSSGSTTTATSGATRAPGPTRSRAKRVWSGVMKYVWVPSERRATRSSIFGPSAAAARSSFGTGSGAASSPSKNAVSLASGLWYSAVASGCPTPTPSRKRPGKSRASRARSAATSAGSCIHTLRIPVATVIAFERSRYGRTCSSDGLPPTHSVPKPAASISATPSSPSWRRRQIPIVPSSMAHTLACPVTPSG